MNARDPYQPTAQRGGGIPVFDLAAPPRPVPLSVRLRVVHGSVISQVGWGILGFSMIFVWIFAASADLSFLTFRGEVRTAGGAVTHSERTSYSEGGSKTRRGTPVYAIHYTFQDQAGGQRRGTSYAVGKELPAAAPVTVEYLADDPGASRIQGMRRAPFGPWVLFVLLFPLVGLVFLLVGVIRGRKGVALLADGVQGRGTLKDKQPTHSRVNKRTVYKLTFSFQAQDGGTYEVSVRTHKPELLQDEPDEPLLYDPLEPSRAVLLDGLPGRPRIDENGCIRTGSTAGTVLSLVIPAGAILGNGIFLLIRYGG